MAFLVGCNKIMSFTFGQGVQTACRVVEGNESSFSPAPIRSSRCTLALKVAHAAHQLVNRWDRCEYQPETSHKMCFFSNTDEFNSLGE